MGRMEVEEESKDKLVNNLITKLSSVSDYARSTALQELRRLSKTDTEIRSNIATVNDGAAISYLSDSLYSAVSTTQENAATTLLNVSITVKNNLISTPGFLDAISHAVSQHRANYSPTAVQSVAATVCSSSIDSSHRAMIGKKRDLLHALLDIVAWLQSPSRSVKDVVKALFSLSLDRANRESLLSLDALEVLFGRVMNDGRAGLVEDVTAVIAQLAGCESAPRAFRNEVGGGIRVLVELIDFRAGGSVRVRENAVSALLKLVEFGGENVAEEIRGVGFGLVFDGLGEVVDCGSDKGKLRAQALMEVLETGMSSSVNSSRNESECYSGPLMDSSLLTDYY